MRQNATIETIAAMVSRIVTVHEHGLDYGCIEGEPGGQQADPSTNQRIIDIGSHASQQITDIRSRPVWS
jgi:hypothetical protein